MTLNIVDQMAYECLMGRARMLSRVLSGLYENELREFGIKASQLNLLVAVAKAGPIRRIDLGKRIHLDPSSLTRNLQVMLNNGWIEEVASGKDGRGQPLKATSRGWAILRKIEPAWSKAQARARAMLGEEGAALLLKLAKVPREVEKK